jgi:hypothetical protein
LLDTIESIRRLLDGERCGGNPLEQAHLSRQQFRRAAAELRDSPEYHRLRSKEAFWKVEERLAKGDDPPRSIPTREDQHELESYLIKIGRAEHEPISDDCIVMLREYGERGVRALRLRGLTEEEIGRPRKLEIVGLDWIYSSQTIYGKARGYKGKHSYFEQDRKNGTFAHFDNNNGKPRYVLADPQLHRQVKAEVQKLNAAKWQRNQGK